MKQFDSNSHSNEFYEALTYRGLMEQGGNNDFITGLPPQPTVAWKNLTRAHRLQILATIDNFINTNSPCQ